MPASVWRGRLAFGMVSIPVRLYKAARRERIRFRHVYRVAESAGSAPEVDDEIEEPELPASKNVREFPGKFEVPAAEPEIPGDTLAPVRNLPVAATTGLAMEKSQILKAVEVEKDRYVTFAPGEIAALRPRTSSELTIAEFVRLEEVNPTFFETSYYVEPDAGGEKPYALLFQALAETGYVAVGGLAMHGREHATILRSGKQGLILHTLFFANEVRADQEYRSDPGLVNAKELDLAKLLVRTLAAPFEPEKLKDTFEEKLRELIAARTGSAVETYSRGGPPQKAPVVDIMEALKQSLAMARRPPKMETAGTPRKAEPAPRQRRAKR